MVFGIVSAAVVVGLIVIGIVSLATLNHVADVQSNHAATLNAIATDTQQIKALTKQIKGYQEAAQNGKTEVDKLLVEAGQEVGRLEASQHAICMKIGAAC